MQPTKTTKRLFRPVIIAALVFGLPVLTCVGAWQLFLAIVMPYTGYVVIEYKDGVSLDGWVDRGLSRFWVFEQFDGRESWKITDLYLQDEDLRVYCMNDLDRATVESWIRDPDDSTDQHDPGRDEGWVNIDGHRYGSGSEFKYVRGRLVEARFGEHSRFKIGRQPDGPFLKLPAKLDEIERVLGPGYRVTMRGREDPFRIR